MTLRIPAPLEASDAVGTIITDRRIRLQGSAWMPGPTIEVVNVAEQITSQIAWWIDEVAQQNDLAAWHFFVYGYPERAALDIRITAPDRMQAQRPFSHRELNALPIRNFVEDEYDKWRNRASKR